MVKFDELKACTLKIENKATKGSVKVFIYVPNKDSIVHELPAGESFKVTTLSAGETFTYLNQATDDLIVTVE